MCTSGNVHEKSPEQRFPASQRSHRFHGVAIAGIRGVRFTPDGAHLLFAERNAKRVSLFTSAGAFVRCIGVGKLSQPCEVELTPSGDILVADCGRHRVFVYSPDGATVLRAFGGEGVSDGKFKLPVAMAMHGDALYVLDCDSPRVQVFL